MAGKPRNRRKPEGSRSGRKSARGGDAAATGASALRVRSTGDDAWELVHPRCARDRQEDLEEVRKMVDAGELEIARDECRWLLQGCSDCLDAHRILGEIALEDNDLPLARGHFGYAYRLGTLALERANVKGKLPYRLAANQGFLESGKALAYCLKQMDKREMAAEVMAQLLACDPSDPLGVNGLLAD